jgi:hypothetical protein
VSGSALARQEGKRACEDVGQYIAHTQSAEISRPSKEENEVDEPCRGASYFR